MPSVPRAVATLLVVSLTLPGLRAADVESLGIVVASRSATLGNGIVSDGATLYNGDRLATGANGALSLRSGGSMVYMTARTQLVLRKSSSTSPANQSAAVRAEVDSGTIAFSLFPGAPLAISAAGASIGIAAPMSTLGEITIIDRKSFEIRARRGPLRIAYFGDSELIPEGKSYRVELDGPDATTSPTIKTRAPRPTGRRKLILLFLIGGAGLAAAATAVGITQSFESPDCPQPNQCIRPN
jgi:hypothetical protein